MGRGNTRSVIDDVDNEGYYANSKISSYANVSNMQCTNLNIDSININM
jgi:hypothetical protein